MSQIYKQSSGSGPLPPEVATSYVTQDGTAVPAANVLIVNGEASSEDNINGIISKGGVTGTGTSNEVDIVLTNRISGTVTTIGATTEDAITFALGATPGIFFFAMDTAAFNASTPAGAGYSTYTTVRTNGTTATVIGDTDAIVHEDAALITTNAELVASGNNVIFQVTGVAGLTIDWVVIGIYVRAT